MERRRGAAPKLAEFVGLKLGTHSGAAKNVGGHQNYTIKFF